jgi:hypothetical protein
MTTRRQFLKWLGIAAAAPLATKLPKHAQPARPGPTTVTFDGHDISRYVTKVPVTTELLEDATVDFDSYFRQHLPLYEWNADPDTGIYQNGDDLKFVVDGKDLNLT